MACSQQSSNQRRQISKWPFIQYFYPLNCFPHCCSRTGHVHTSVDGPIMQRTIRDFLLSVLKTCILISICPLKNWALETAGSRAREGGLWMSTCTAFLNGSSLSLRWVGLGALRVLRGKGGKVLRETLVIRQPLYRSIHINSAEAEEEKITESGDRDEGKHSAASVNRVTWMLLLNN